MKTPQSNYEPIHDPRVAGVKKPYQKPAFRFERTFETRALTCGKIQSTQGSCHFNRNAS